MYNVFAAVLMALSMPGFYYCKWSITFKNGRSLYCMPVIYITLHSNVYNLIKNNKVYLQEKKKFCTQPCTRAEWNEINWVFLVWTCEGEFVVLEAMTWPEELHKFLESISRSQLLTFSREELLLPNLPKYGANVNLTRHLIIHTVFW